MFSYLIVALFTVLAVSSSPLPSASSSLDPCDLPTLAPSSVPTHTPSATPSSSPSPPATLMTVSDAWSNGPFTDGYATYFYQNGNPGACGQFNADTAYICAMDQTRFGTSGPASPLCGQQVQITNLDNGQQVTVTIADDCPTCANQDSIDLSVAAFQAISDLSVGEIPISWVFV